MESVLKTAAIAVAVAAIGVAYNLAPVRPVDPLTEALKLCGDTPKPVDYQRVGEGRFSFDVPVEPTQRPFALAVKSVDDCRAKVLDHFKANQS